MAALPSRMKFTPFCILIKKESTRAKCTLLLLLNGKEDISTFHVTSKLSNRC